MNKHLIAERFSKAIGTYPREANVQQQIAEKMIRLLEQHLPSPPLGKVFEFGCGTGNYSRMLHQAMRPEQLILNDICSKMQTCCTDLLSLGATFLGGDAETTPFPENLQLITSCSTLQWFENPEGFFHRCYDHLGKNGYFAFTTFGEENMKEIRRITGQGLVYRSLRELDTALSPLYDIVCSEEEIVPRYFSTPLQVLYHLKETGVTGTTGCHRWTRGELNRFSEEYARLFSHGSVVSLTYHPIYIIVKKKVQ